MEVKTLPGLPTADQNLIFLINNDGTKHDDCPQQDYDGAVQMMWDDFFASPIGKTMKDLYTDESLEAVDRVYQRDYSAAIYGWKTILSHRMQAVVQKMHDAGDPGLVLKDSKKPRVVTPAQPVRPKDAKTGKFLTDVEIEARADMASNTQAAVIAEKRRTRTDYREAYDLFKFQSLGIEVQRSTKPGLEWEPKQPPKPVVSQELRAFARAWENTPTKQLHALAGFITLSDGSQYTVEEYERNLGAAAPLLRGGKQ